MTGRGGNTSRLYSHLCRAANVKCSGLLREGMNTYIAASLLPVS